MATTDQPRSPSSINFIKEGLLIPTRNSGLFTAVLVLNIACAAVAALPYALVILPLGIDIFANIDILLYNSPFPGSHRRSRLMEVQASVQELLITMVASLLATTVVSSAVSVVSAHAAVVTSVAGAEGPHGLGSFLASAKSNLRGPFATALLSNVLPLLCAGTVAPLALLMHPAAPAALEVPFVTLLIVFALLFTRYLSNVLCSMSIVVSVAEPGCHGAGAFGRALQLAAAKSRKFLLFMVMQSVATAAIWMAYTHAGSLEYGGLVIVYMLLHGALQVVSVCAATAFYYECKLQIKQDAVDDVYAKVQTDEPNNA